MRNRIRIRIQLRIWWPKMVKFYSWNREALLNRVYPGSMFYPREYWINNRWPDFLTDLWFGSSPTPSPLSCQKARPATHRKTKKERQNGKRGGGREVSYKSRIVWPQESLILYGSFSTLCFVIWGYGVTELSQIETAKWPETFVFHWDFRINVLTCFMKNFIICTFYKKNFCKSAIYSAKNLYTANSRLVKLIVRCRDLLSYPYIRISVWNQFFFNSERHFFEVYIGV